ncbi:MAG: hypothetical protein PHR35_12980 [Kiritimatiellae bacterium]|nr:hypothetical protein [Kiritimatiellia bacterium]
MQLSPEARRALGEGWLDEVRRLSGKPDLDIQTVENPDDHDAGLIMLDGDGRQTWDSRLQSRLRRLWPELRIMIAARAGLMDPPARGPESAKPLPEKTP